MSGAAAGPARSHEQFGRAQHPEGDVDTRPARPREGRQIAGVAAAIARRYDIDPVLVRVGFVVAAFYGIGAALYIAGWALLPDEPGPRSRRAGADEAAAAGPARCRARPASAGCRTRTAASSCRPRRSRRCCSCCTAAARPGDRRAGALRLHRGADADRRPTGAPPNAAPPRPPGTRWVPPPSPGTCPSPAPSRSRTAAPLAGHPGDAGRRAARRGVTALVLLAAGGLTDLPVLFGVLLSVLGGGLLVGAFTRSGRGLIPVALLVAALTWARSPRRWTGSPPRPPQDLHLAPTLRPRSRRSTATTSARSSWTCAGWT